MTNPSSAPVPASPEGPRHDTEEAWGAQIHARDCWCRSPEGPDEGLREQVLAALDACTCPYLLADSCARVHAADAVLPLLTAERKNALDAMRERDEAEFALADLRQSNSTRQVEALRQSEREARERGDRLAQVIREAEQLADPLVALRAALSATDPGSTR